MCDMPVPFGAEFDATAPGPFEPQVNNNSNNNYNSTRYELRAGRMHTNCDCSRRNGLQDNCSRGLCRTGQYGGLQQSSPSPFYDPTSFNSMPMMDFQKPNYAGFEGGFGKLSGFPEYTSNNMPMEGYQNYPTDMPLQMPTGAEQFNPVGTNFMPNPGNAYNGNQTNYPCYL